MGRVDGVSRRRRRLVRLGLGELRTAIARALANNPKILLADEPTGNLDPKTSDVVFDALLNLVRKEGLAALIATHDQRLAKRMDRVFVIREQRLVEVKKQMAQT